MKTYKTIKHLEKRALKNNGKKVFIWDDSGIVLENHRFSMLEYGNMGHNWTGNEYIVFGNKNKGNIEIEYKLTKGEERGNTIFNLIEIRDLRKD